MNFPLHDSDKLIKQTYSVYVFLPEDRGQDVTRKWHLTAYFKQRTVDDLTPIEDIPNVGRIQVPDGLFKSARATKNKKDDSKRNAMGTSAGSESYPMPSGSGALYTIFPSSGNGPQTAHAYTQDGSMRSHHSHSVAPLRVDAIPPAGSVTASRASTIPPSPSSPMTPRAVPVGIAHAHAQARLAGARQMPSLVPLEHLQSCSITRDPTDERMLQQLSASRSGSADPRTSPTVPGGSASRKVMTPYNGF